MKLSCEVDFTELNKIIRNMQQLEDRSVEAGYGNEQHSDSGLTMGQLASIHEHGVRSASGGWRIPPRNFMAQSVPLWQDSIKEASARAVDYALVGDDTSLKSTLNSIAKEGEKAIKLSLDNNDFIALSPITVKIKKDRGARRPTTALINTEELYSGMESKVK